MNRETIKIKNVTEKSVADAYASLGYEYLKKGWPDFLFRKDGKIVLVEVKKRQTPNVKRDGLKRHQREVLDVLSTLFECRVEYVNKEGTLIQSFNYNKKEYTLY